MNKFVLTKCVLFNCVGIVQLRYLQTLNTISAEKNSTIIFPLPIDILKHFLKPDKKKKEVKDDKEWRKKETLHYDISVKADQTTR